MCKVPICLRCSVFCRLTVSFVHLNFISVCICTRKPFKEHGGGCNDKSEHINMLRTEAWPGWMPYLLLWKTDALMAWMLPKYTAGTLPVWGSVLHLFSTVIADSPSWTSEYVVKERCCTLSMRCRVVLCCACPESSFEFTLGCLYSSVTESVLVCTLVWALNALSAGKNKLFLNSGIQSSRN